MLLWDGSIGKNSYPFSGLVSPAYKVFQHSQDIDPDFLELLLRSPLMIPHYRSISQGTNTRRRKAHFVDFSDIQIPLPSRPEQRAIASILRSVQRACKETAQVITATREMKKSLNQHLFTYGPVALDQVDQVQLNDTNKGSIPVHWELKEVIDLGEIVTGTTPSTGRVEYYGGPYSLISPGDLGQSKYVAATQKTLSEAGLAVSRVLPKDSILVVCIGATIGKTGLTSAKRSATNQQINAVVANRSVDPHFLYYALTHHASDLLSMAGRAAVPIVNKGNFSRLKLPFPPLAEQQKIASILGALDNKLEAERARERSCRALFDSLLHYLMTGKIRVHDIPEVSDVAR